MSGPSDWEISCAGCGARHQGWMAECPKCGRRDAPVPSARASTPPAERTAPTAASPRSARRAIFQAYCPFCAKHAPPNATRCPRCPPPAAAPSGGACPRCKQQMREVVRDGVTVDVCDGCRGVWLDRGEVEKVLPLVTHGTGGPRGRVPVRGMTEPVVYLACVRCHEQMARRQFAPRAGVIVDLCREHGLWFDGSELERIAAFVQAGGLESAREHEDRTSARAPRTIDASSATRNPLVYGAGSTVDSVFDFLGSLD